MNTLVCSLAVPALTLVAQPNVPTNSVVWIDDRINYMQMQEKRRGTKLTDRTLRRTVCKDIENAEPFLARTGTVHELDSVIQRREHCQRMVSEHCQRRVALQGDAIAAVECGEGFRR